MCTHYDDDDDDDGVPYVCACDADLSHTPAITTV